MSGIRECCNLILEEIGRALAAVEEPQAEGLVQAILSAEKVFVVGVGRVLLTLQALVKRLNHLGVPAWYVGAVTEPAITGRDLLIVGSGSGESVVPVAIARVAKKHGARVAHIGSNPQSSLAPLTDLFVRVPVQTKLNLPGELASRQLLSSLFEQCLLVLGDAVCLRLAELRGIPAGADAWGQHANLE